MLNLVKNWLTIYFENYVGLLLKIKTKYYLYKKILKLYYIKLLSKIINDNIISVLHH